MPKQFLLTVAAAALQVGLCVQAAPADEPNSNTFVHQGSQISLPPVVGGCERAAIERFDESGDDVGTLYTCSRDPSLIINLFVYPAARDPNSGEPVSFTQECDGEGAAILEAHAGSQQIRWPNPFITENDEGVRACHTAFALPQLQTRAGPIKALSLLQLYDYGRWRLKFRISYPEHNAMAAEQIRAFHQSFPWRKRS